MAVLAEAGGVVLHRVRHGETSLILNVFTRESGKVGLMAKGARSKGKMGSAAALELFAESQFIYYKKASRDLQLLKEWSLVAAHTPLREDFDRLAVGSAVIELLARCLHEEDPHPLLYDATVAMLEALDRRPAYPLPLLWAFELKLFRELGFDLQMETCALSGKPLTPPFESAVHYRMSDGSFLHPSQHGDPTYSGQLPAEAFAALARLSTASYELAGRMALNPRINREIGAFLTRYLETHLPVKGKLRSLAALFWGAPPTE